jgi:hypothetical protein
MFEQALCRRLVLTQSERLGGGNALPSRCGRKKIVYSQTMIVCFQTMKGESRSVVSRRLAEDQTALKPRDELVRDEIGPRPVED